MSETSYSSIALDNSEISKLAINIIKQHLSGLPVGQARQVLNEVVLLIDATMLIDCETSEFHRACEGFQDADS
ncbi:hypothetical protein DA391_20335 [Yersinia massiliensis]|uniref:Uncharacterized protein n=1 Tax=Yersinia massiliensis TaxID=419257 RepID=A0ABM6UZ07_9GAMM|nr:hypothetical protein DA391_20335 [Yersinia massiliensis]